MKLSTLPWPTRREIIQLVIQDCTEYSRINKEWFEQTARVHGEVILNTSIPYETEIRDFSRYIGKLWLGRVNDINWEILHSYKNTRKVVFNIQRQYSQTELEEFNSNLLQLPFIESIKIHIHNDEEFDITNFLLRNQQHLKELITPIEQISRCLELDEAVFSNLNSLNLEQVKHTNDLRKIAKAMPQLKKLFICFCDYLETVSFVDINLLKLIELSFCSGDLDDSILKLDLNSLPRLKKIRSLASIELVGSNSVNSIDELMLGGTNDYISSIRFNEFTSLKILDLNLYDTPNPDIFQIIFQLCTTVTSLKLSTWEEFEFPANLPVACHKVANLYLKGRFKFTTNLLQWLSDNFNLIKLELKYCELDQGVPLKKVSFKSLKCLTIYSRNQVSEFKYHFNKVSYPLVDTIEVIRVCSSCSEVLDSDEADH